MKRYLIIIGSLTCLVLNSCEKKKAPVAPVRYVEPTPSPTPTSTPTATPAPTPQARLAPPGTLYVVKNFSIRTEDGLHGFPPGKKVTLVREDILDLIVTDDVIEGRAPKDSFTNDLDILDAVMAKTAKMQQAAQQTRNVQQ